MSVDVGIDSYHLPHKRGHWCCSHCPEASSLLHPSIDVATVFLISVDFSLRSRHVDDGAVVVPRCWRSYHTTVVVGTAVARPRNSSTVACRPRTPAAQLMFCPSTLGPFICGQSHRSVASASYDSSVDVGTLVPFYFRSLDVTALVRRLRHGKTSSGETRVYIFIFIRRRQGSRP